ncbi:MAG: hypothetical protein ACXABY_23140, partial [Candidatus Thorarchaeota archaeon]
GGLGTAYLYLSEDDTNWDSGTPQSPSSGTYTWNVDIEWKYIGTMYYYVVVWDDDNTPLSSQWQPSEMVTINNPVLTYDSLGNIYDDNTGKYWVEVTLNDPGGDILNVWIDFKMGCENIPGYYFYNQDWWSDYDHEGTITLKGWTNLNNTVNDYNGGNNPGAGDGGTYRSYIERLPGTSNWPWTDDRPSWLIAADNNNPSYGKGLIEFRVRVETSEGYITFGGQTAGLITDDDREAPDITNYHAIGDMTDAYMSGTTLYWAFNVSDLNKGDSGIKTDSVQVAWKLNGVVQSSVNATGSGYGTYTAALSPVYLGDSIEVVMYASDNDLDHIRDWNYQATVPSSGWYGEMFIIDDDTIAPDITGIQAPTSIDFMSGLTITCTAQDLGDGLSDAYLYISDDGNTWDSPLSDSPSGGTYEWLISDITGYIDTDLYFYIYVEDSDDERGSEDIQSTYSGVWIVDVTISATYYTESGVLTIEDDETSLLYNVTIPLSTTISHYRYLSITSSGENLTTAQIDIITDAGSNIQSLDLVEGYDIFDLSSLGTTVYRIVFQVKPDGTGTGLLEVDEIRVSPIQTKISGRTQINVKYTTDTRSVDFVMDDHLLSWNGGVMEIDDVTDSHVKTEVLDWYSDYIAVRQSLYTGEHIDIMMSSDGRIDISVSSDTVDFSFAMTENCDKYSDSFGIVDVISTDLIVRTPTFVAMYADGVGFGLTDLSGQEVTVSTSESWIEVDSSSEKIILLPVLKERFQIVSGVEIDPNFVVSLSDIHATGLLSGWQGGIESQNATFIDGEFNEEYAVLETFDTQSRWIIDNDNNGATSQTTQMALEKTRLSFSEGVMNVTINANETVSDVVVFEYNYVQFTASDYPFLRFAVDGDGRLKIDVKLRIDDTRHTVLSVTPDGNT